jgi:molybdopterin-guanine dinucleotide biosynthesis protein B
VDDDCTVLSNDKNLQINGFTRNIVANSVKAMVNSIKTEEDVKSIDVDISGISEDLKDAEINLMTNGNDVELNSFTQAILKETIFSIVNTLKIDEKINKITIKVTGNARGFHFRQIRKTYHFTENHTDKQMQRKLPVLPS